MGHPTDPIMRVATSGTEATGKNYSNSPATAGLVFTSAGADVVPIWAAASALPQLTLTRILDNGTPIAPAAQNGTFGAPYSTMAQCIADLPNGGTILVVPGDYTTQAWTFTHAGTMTIVNLAGLWNSVYGSPAQSVLAPAISSTNGIVLQGIVCTSTVSALTATLWAKYCGFVAATTISSIVAENCTFSLAAAVTTTGADTHYIGCAFNFVGTVITTPPNATFIQTTFTPLSAIFISGGGGRVILDQATFNSFSEGLCTTNGSYLVLGTPLSGVVSTAANPTLAAGRTLLATVPVTAAFDQPTVVANFCGGAPPTGVLLDAIFAGGIEIDIYISNYTGVPVAYPGGDVRWKVLAP